MLGVEMLKLQQVASCEVGPEGTRMSQNMFGREPDHHGLQKPLLDRFPGTLPHHNIETDGVRIRGKIVLSPGHCSRRSEYGVQERASIETELTELWEILLHTGQHWLGMTF